MKTLSIIVMILYGLFIHNISFACDDDCKDFILKTIKSFENHDAYIKSSKYYHPEYSLYFNSNHNFSIAIDDMSRHFNHFSSEEIKISKSRKFYPNLKILDIDSALFEQIIVLFGNTGYGVSFIFYLKENQKYFVLLDEDIYIPYREYDKDYKEKIKLGLEILNNPKAIDSIQKNSHFYHQELSRKFVEDDYYNRRVILDLLDYCKSSPKYFLDYYNIMNESNDNQQPFYFEHIINYKCSNSKLLQFVYRLENGNWYLSNVFTEVNEDEEIKWSYIPILPEFFDEVIYK